MKHAADDDICIDLEELELELNIEVELINMGRSNIVSDHTSFHSTKVTSRGKNGEKNSKRGHRP